MGGMEDRRPSSPSRSRLLLVLSGIYFLVLITSAAPSHHVVLGIPGVPSSANHVSAQIHASFSNRAVMNPFQAHLAKEFRSILATTPEFRLSNTGSGLNPRKRKSIGTLCRIYAGLWKGHAAGGQGSNRTQRYAIRSGNRSKDDQLPPSTTSAEYFVSEFRRLFSNQPTPRRPYAMRLRWG